MKFNAQTTTTTRTERPQVAPGSIHNLPNRITSPGPVIRQLDLSVGDAHGDLPAETRTLWVSLTHPRLLLGHLLDETTFEGVWIEADGRARIRLQGQGERTVPTPLFHSPEAARAWLASELLQQVADSHDPGTHDFPGTTPESLAA